MSRIFKHVSLVVENPDQYPYCMVQQARELLDVLTTSRSAAATLKTQYRDFWYTYIQLFVYFRVNPEKKTSRTTGQSVSLELHRIFAKNDLEEFHKLKTQLHGKKQYSRAMTAAFLAMQQLVNYRDAQELYKFIAQLNVNQTHFHEHELRSVASQLSAQRIAEIVAWKLAQSQN